MVAAACSNGLGNVSVPQGVVSTQQKRAEAAALGSFLTGLGAVVEGVRDTLIRMDRVAATRFSVFWYFKHNENIISRIFADMLRGDGIHGQGTAFLDLFLEEIVRDPADGAGSRPAAEYVKAASGGCVVETEHVIPGRRRIDIVVRLGTRGEQWLAIENKPWAREQENQLDAYADYVHQHDPRACVIYLSGDGSESSTMPAEKRGYYRAVPYRNVGGGPSVEGWIRRCVERCEADRVRWFLTDMLKYIEETFQVEEADDE